MAIRVNLCQQDEAELLRIRTQLIAARQERGITQRAMAKHSQRSEKFFNEAEQGLGHLYLSSLQEWARVFDLRVQPTVYGLSVDDFKDTPQALLTHWDMARRMSFGHFDADEWTRTWIVAELTCYRYALGISAAKLSRKMGLSISAVSGWERDGFNPLCSKIMIYARMLGGYVTFDLVSRKEWGAG